mmetsp:Transcript_34399/g.61398  ORF Transcript_34399/g.61398 Transcript_34399/m.61398 type:complete len:156 (-) Transcript_34399:319-786(-)
MPCYYGCSTAGSRVAWCLYFVFFVAMAGCWIGFGVGFAKCAESAVEPEGPCEVLVEVQLEPTQSFENSSLRSVADVSAEVCVQEYNLTATHPDYDDCVTCLTDLSLCILEQRWTALAALILCLLTLGPCFYCCCCASPAGLKYANDAAAPIGGYR